MFKTGPFESNLIRKQTIINGKINNENKNKPINKSKNLFKI
tara:strand:+ start:3361 stop:3483 length:123 start_codon:yes stop_codon:yes gene_type:complete